jgi:hypothetical protein
MEHPSATLKASDKDKFKKMTDIAASFVKLAIRFNPMQPKRV